jgi:glycerophosphoryl diester phosphodiesterase
VQQRLPSIIDQPIAFAHRGARAHAPENTLDAFGLALRLGATGLESDVWLTREGEPVLDHDGVVRRRGRKVPFATLARHELPSHVPSLGELLHNCGTATHLSLDLKDPTSGPVVLATVREHDPSALGRLWLCAPDHRTLLPLREMSPEVQLLESTRLARVTEGPERRAATLASLGIDGINLHHTDWNGGLVSLFHRFGLVAFAWDLQFEHVLRPVLRMGVDAVYSDVVDVMMDVYRDELGRPI